MLKKLVFIQALLILSLSSAAGQAVDKTIRGAVSQGNTQRVLCSNCDDDMGDDDGSYDDYYYGKSAIVDTRMLALHVSVSQHFFLVSQKKKK